MSAALRHQLLYSRLEFIRLVEGADVDRDRKVADRTGSDQGRVAVVAGSS